MTEPVDRVETFELTVPALTPKTEPRRESTWFASGEVIWFELQIPDGPAGYSGVRIATDSRQLMPNNTGKWVISNDEVITHDVYSWPNSGHLWLEGYNEDVNAHTYTVRYGIREIQALAPPAPIVQGTTPISAPTPPAPSAPPEAVAGEPPPLEPEGAPEAPPPVGEAPPPPTPEPPPPVTAPEAPTPIPPIEAEAPAPLPPGEAPPVPEAPIATFPGAPAEPEAPEVEPGVREGPPQVVGSAAQRVTSARAPQRRRTVVRVITRRVSLPAGGWLPEGARFTLKRTDQGQDFITNWQGPVTAPGNGYVVHNLSDRPFPGGFGPHYVVVHITDGRFAGNDWYIGHCTSDMRDGEHFVAGRILAHADQGHVENGGWVEVGLAPNGVPGPMGTGARFAHLFGPLSVVHRVRRTEHVGGRAPRRSPAHPRSPANRRSAPRAGTRPGQRREAPRRAAARAPAGRRAAPPRRAPATRGRPAPRGRAPAPRRAPAPPRAAPPPRAPARPTAPPRRHR